MREVSATMKYQIEKAVADIGVKVVFGSVEGVDNTGRNPEWEAERKVRLENLQKRFDGLDIHGDEVFEGYHILHDKSGVKRRKNIPSSENLIKMLLKHGDMPFINQVVDIYNVISMESRLCVAAHNLDKVDGNLTVRFSDGTEKYIPLGQKQPVPMNPHEYCYCDDSNEVLCRLEIRQVNKTKVDENVRDVVVRIFKERLAGKSLAQIARGLNADGIMAPSVYWQSIGVIHKEKYRNLWEGKQVRRILENVVYTGDVEISKTYRAYYRGITRAVSRDKGERFYVEGHHEAIIDHETFDRVQELMQETKAGYEAARQNLGGERNKREDKLQGLLYCGHCGNKMNLYRKTVKLVNGYGHYSTYVCRRAATYGEADPPKNVKAEAMEMIVMELLKAHMAVYVDARERMRMLNQKPEAAEKRSALKKELSGKKARREKIGGFIQALYADFADGVFSEEEYLEMKAGYVSELEALDGEMARLKEEMEGLALDYAGNGEMAAAFGKYLGAEELTKEMAQTFIRKIVCYGSDRFEVEYTFAGELAELVEKGGDGAA